MKKKIFGRILFGSVLVLTFVVSGFLFFKNVNQSSAAGECYPESAAGAGDGFCMGISWSPAQDVWHSEQRSVIFRADPAITPAPTEAEVREYGLFPATCTTGSNYGDTCPSQVCYYYKRGASLCRQSPINKFDNLPPVCGDWTRSGNTFTLSGSTDAPASGNSGSSGINVAGGTCTATAGGTCSVVINDNARNQTTCTSPVNPAVYTCTGSSPTNSSMCSGDDSGLTGPTDKTLVPACTVADKCEFTCNSGYQYQNILGFPACVPVSAAISCSPRSQSIGLNAGARFEAAGGDGNYNWSIPYGSCSGEVEPGNPAVFWPACNAPGSYWVNVSDNSGHSDSCVMEVVGNLDCTVTPDNATVVRGGSVGFGVSSNIQSTGANQIFVSAYGFANGLSSSLYLGTIPPGSNSLGFGVTAEMTAALGTSQFSVSCSMDCPVGGCPSGGSPSNEDTNPVTITVVDGTPPAGCNYNRVQDNGETGVDCGGGNCPSCNPPACVRYWETNPYYECQNNSCTRVDACGSSSGGCNSLNVGAVCGQSIDGTITVRADSPGANWLISGPQDAYPGNGTFKMYQVPSPGIYSLYPGEGYSVDVESQFLPEGGSITFNVTRGAQPTCFVSAVPSSATANIGANASFTATTTCSDGSTPPVSLDLVDWAVNKSASFVSGENNSRTTTLRCDSSTGGVPALVTPSLGTLTSIASNLTCNPALTCSPVNQEADINQSVSFSAAGGSSYSWTATGGTPASGSGSSFSTRYNSLGNKTVTVTSGGNNASCSVSVIQPTHSECTMVDGAPACVIVDGRAPDRCTNKCDCGSSAPECGGTTPPGGGSPLKYSCKSGSCSVDSTGPYTDSTCGGTCSPTYYSCSGGSCMPDANGQFTSADCNNMCVMPIHAVCDPVAKACVNTVGAGSNTCSADAGGNGCGGTTQTHLGCVGNACVIMNGPGSDECGAVGEACATGGGKCSLKAAPPLVSGGQSVKLSWQCTGAPTCSLTRKYNNSNTTITVQDPARRTTGSYSDKPTSSATYTLKCDVPAADATASVKVSTLIECAPTDPNCKP